MFPTAVEGVKVLDFGSGSGRDCYILSKLVGENGFVTGVDMTQEQVCACVYAAMVCLLQKCIHDFLQFKSCYFKPYIFTINSTQICLRPFEVHQGQIYVKMLEEVGKV